MVIYPDICLDHSLVMVSPWLSFDTIWNPPISCCWKRCCCYLWFFMDPKWSKHLLRRSRKHPKSTPKYFLRRYGWIHRVWFNDVGCLLSNSIIFGTTRAATILMQAVPLVQPKHNKSGHKWTQQSVECLVDPKYYSSIPHALLDNNISIFADSTKSAHRSAPLNPGTKKTPGTFPFSAPAIGRLKLLHLQLHLGALDFFCLAFRRFVLTTWDRDGIGQLEAEFFVCKTLKHTVWIH